jgi:hypothetical protein
LIPPPPGSIRSQQVRIFFSGSTFSASLDTSIEGLSVRVRTVKRAIDPL